MWHTILHHATPFDTHLRVLSTPKREKHLRYSHYHLLGIVKSTQVTGAVMDYLLRKLMVLEGMSSNQLQLSRSSKFQCKPSWDLLSACTLSHTMAPSACSTGQHPAKRQDSDRCAKSSLKTSNSILGGCVLNSLNCASPRAPKKMFTEKHQMTQWRTWNESLFIFSALKLSYKAKKTHCNAS